MRVGDCERSKLSIQKEFPEKDDYITLYHVVVIVL